MSFARNQGVCILDDSNVSHAVPKNRNKEEICDCVEKYEFKIFIGKVCYRAGGCTTLTKVKEVKELVVKRVQTRSKKLIAY